MSCMRDGFDQGMLLQGRYRAVSPLNQGSFGMVYLADDTMTGTPVAIKCLSKKSSTPIQGALDYDEHSLERSCHQILGEHPNIVNLLTSFETRAHIYLVLEFCSMGDLYEAIRLGRGPLETENVRELMLQLISAAEFMHSKGFYHRDIKPENIFIAQDGSMKLGDLGLATSDAWSHEASVGSDRYMAPEQYAPEEHGYAPAKADIWAIGICLLNVLFARNPFITPTESDVLFADFARDNRSLFDIFPNMSQDTFNVLTHALALDPTKRSLSAVRTAIEKVVDFTTDEEVLDDFCAETPGVALASANREPLRTPSISSPQVDSSGAFPWAKILQTSPPRVGRQLSTVPDTESCSEDLFSQSEAARDSWYSAARNSSLTSGLESAFGTSIRSMVLAAPVPRNIQRTQPVAVPSSLPARIPTLSSIFGNRNSVAKSWTDMWDEDEEGQDNSELLDDHHGDTAKIEESTRGLAEISDAVVNSRTVSPKSDGHRGSADGFSEQGVFVFEDAAPRYSPPSKRSTKDEAPPSPQSKAESTSSKRQIMDRWSALGNRRRAFNNDVADPTSNVKGKWMNTRDWRAGFGLKVFSSSNTGRMGGFTKDKNKDKETSFNAKVRSWRDQQQRAQTPHHSREDLGADLEWVGA